MQGSPIAHMISSDEKSNTIKKFYNFVKLKFPCLISKIITLVSDDYIAYYNQFLKIFGEPFAHILCPWHVRKNLKKRFNIKPNTDYKYLILNKLLLSPNEQEYKKNLQVVKEAFNSDDFDFLVKNYISRKEKIILAFQKNPIGYNLHIEAFHGILKTKYLGKKKIKELTC